MIKYLDIKSAGKILDIVKKYFVRNKDFCEAKEILCDVKENKQEKLRVVKTSELKSDVTILMPNTYYIVDDDNYKICAQISSAVKPEDEIVIQFKGYNTIVLDGQITWEHEPVFNRDRLYIITIKNRFASFKEYFTEDKPKLPPKYQRVEWIKPKIEYDEFVYINTDYVFTRDSNSFKIDFSFADYPSSGYLYGMSEKIYYDGEEFYIHGNNVVITTGAPIGHYYEVVLDKESIQLDVVHTIESVLSNSNTRYGYVKLDGEWVTSKDETSEKIPMYLFSCNFEGKTPYKSAYCFRIHRYTVFDRVGSKVVDMIPCYEKDTMRVGMYDVIRERMFYNSHPEGDVYHSFDYGKEVY